MKKIDAFLLAACLLLSGCGQGTVERKQETTGQIAEQTAETETVTEPGGEETETELEPMVTICTGIDSRIIEKDSSFEHMDWLDSYLDASEFSLIKMDCPEVYQMSPCLFREDESEGWTQDDWDLVRLLGQITTAAMGYGKIDYDNDGEKEYIYRLVENGMTATGYKVSGDGKEITGEYDLVDFFAQFYGEGKLLRQLWFSDFSYAWGVVSFCLIEDSPKNFTLNAFLVEGDSARVLEKRILNVRTMEVPEREAYSDKNIFASQSHIFDFIAEDSRAYDLTREELKNLRQNRDIKIADQETELPGELVEVLQNILTGMEKDEEISPDDLLEPYEAKDCKLDDDYALELLRDSDSDLMGVMDAYRTDLGGDGKEEIIMRSYYGGNGLAKSIKVWRESEDGAGRYVKEEIGGASNATLLFIDGNYYYVARTYSHYLASSIWRVYSFSEDGAVKADEFTIEPQGTGMSWTKLYENEKVESQILNGIQTYVESRKDEIEGDEILWGNAEQPLAYTSDCKAVDVDNDGEMESCFKERVHDTSSAGGPVWLHTVISKKHGNVLREIEFDLAKEFFPESIERYMWQLWFEEFDGKNYIFCMERLDGSLDAFLGVFLIQDQKLYPVMNYLLLDNKVCKYEKADPEFYINYK